MDFVFDDYDSDEMIHEVTLIDKASGKVFNQNLIFWYLEMSKFKKKISDVGNRRDEWFFMKNRQKPIMPA
jgi:hypothetical protein